MTVIIRGHRLGTAGISKNSGIFIGQNVQDGWDSCSTEKGATGYDMGDFNAVTTGLSFYLGRAQNWQGVDDSDCKGNAEIRRVR